MPLAYDGQVALFDVTVPGAASDFLSGINK